MNFVQADKLDNALQLLADDEWALLAGGTDFYPALSNRPATGNILDISALTELRKIKSCGEYFRIGAGVTWSDIIEAELPSGFDGLQLCAREIGSVQIQNRATLVGNICNASPAADGVPVFLTLDVIVEISSAQGTRKIPLSNFIVGNRQTRVEKDEMVTALLIPHGATEGNSSFLKLGARKYLVISISMVAARLVFDEQDCISCAAIAVGSCSLVAQRLKHLEEDLVGVHRADLASMVIAGHMNALSPIDDVRASAEYRLRASMILVQRAISLAAGNK